MNPNPFRWLFAVVPFLPLLAGGCAATEPSRPVVVDLKIVENKPHPWRALLLDKTGEAKLPFACPAGSLAFHVADGKLRVDTGAPADKDAPAVQLKENFNEPTRLTLPVTLAGKTAPYPLDVYFQKSGEDRMLMIGSGAVLEGRFHDAPIRIEDRNLDGHFGGRGNGITYNPTDLSSGFGNFPWTRTLMLDKKLYDVELLGDGAQLKLTPYTGPIAEVEIRAEKAPDILVLREDNEERTGMWFPDQPGQFVPGAYRIRTILYLIKSGDRTGKLGGMHDPRKPPFELKAGKNVLKLGPPLTMDFIAVRDKDMIEISDVTFTGIGGELYRSSIDEERGDSFAWYIRSGVKEMKLAKLEFS